MTEVNEPNSVGAFQELTHALFELGRENCVRDGFQVETILGINPVGIPAAVFASAGGMNANEMTASMPKGAFVTSQPLTRATDVIEEAFHRRAVQCAVYTAVVDIDNEGYLIGVGVWPDQLYAHGYAAPLTLTEFDAAVTEGITGDGHIAAVLRDVVDWVAYMLPKHIPATAVGVDDAAK